MSTLVPGATPVAFSPAAPAPHETLVNIATGRVIARAPQVVVDVAVADALGEAPQPAAALAHATGAHPQALERLLRLLGSYGVFAVDGAGMVSHTAASRVPRADHPQSFEAGARLWGLPFIRGSSEHFAHALRTGRPAAEAFAPAGLFPYLAWHPGEARALGGAMASKTHAPVAGVLAAYDVASFGLIGDIGGGHGHLVSAILDRTPGARGVLFDQPHVIAEVPGLSSDRLALVGGDFFHDALPVCDAYVLMEIIHDWGDAEAAAILRAVRAAAPPHAVLLLVEDIVPDGVGPSWARTLDVVMLAVTGGLQRTAREYDALLAGCGFRIERVLDTPTGISIVEARPV